MREIWRYGLVGGGAALIHAALLRGLPALGVPLAIGNLLGFLTASLWGYLAHALFTFRRQTGGERFPRRWLLAQIGLNVALSLLLPALLGPLARTVAGTLLLVFTPTLVNLLLWSLAAAQVQRLRAAPLGAVRVHADDLGLAPEVNRAIFALADAGCLQSASLLVNGPALADALAGLAEHPQLEVCLHLNLSEGLPLAPPEQVPDLLDRQGRLALRFGSLLLASLLPARLAAVRRLRQQLALEIRAQIAAFRAACPERPLRLDGHQHMHLLPIVGQVLFSLESASRPVWLRSLREPLPAGIPLRDWTGSLLAGGGLKWLLLQGLEGWQRTGRRRLGIASNRAFAGALFTGRMGSAVQRCARRQLASTLGADPAGNSTLSVAVGSDGVGRDAKGRGGPGFGGDRGSGPGPGGGAGGGAGGAQAWRAPQLLLHPSLIPDAPAAWPDFPLSARFYGSRWRQLEYRAALALAESAADAAGPAGAGVMARTK